MTIELALTSDMEEVRSSLTQVCAWLETHNIPQSCTATIEVATAEALNNVAEHGYGGRTDGSVRIRGRLTKPWVWIHILDHGSPMPKLSLTNASLPETTDDVQSLPEGGFGLFLISNLARRFRYDTCTGENRLSLLFDAA